MNYRKLQSISFTDLDRLRHLPLSQLDELLKSLGNNDQEVFVKSSYSDIDAFFDEVYKDYDTDLRNPYWNFSHDILKFLLLHELLENFDVTRQLNVLDAGAGTGNWSKYIKDCFPSSKTVLFDRNHHMLSVARTKFSSLQSRNTSFVEGNLEQLENYLVNQFDVIICFHNVIGMARNSENVLSQLAKRLREDGIALIMAPNFYHSLIFLLNQKNMVEFHRTLVTGTVKFKKDMPEVFCYTPESLRQLIINSGFKSCKILGFPVTVFPEQNDRFLKVETTSHHCLNDTKMRAGILALEKRLCLKEELAYRAGNSLLAIAKI